MLLFIFLLMGPFIYFEIVPVILRSSILQSHLGFTILKVSNLIPTIFKFFVFYMFFYKRM